MTMENATIVIACPDCRKQMRMNNPGKAGVYKITCPFCCKQFSVKMVDNANQKPQHADEAPVLVQHCTNCGVKMRIRNPQQGTHSVKCPNCQSVQTYSYRSDAAQSGTHAPQEAKKEEYAPTKTLPKNFNLAQGCLVVHRGRFASKQVYELKGKETVVGRADSESPSDISVAGDPTMSRRSICISTEAKSMGFLYKLTVLNATNKVLYNNRALAKGDSVYLNFGDRIMLGKTLFSFEKSQ